MAIAQLLWSGFGFFLSFSFFPPYFVRYVGGGTDHLQEVRTLSLIFEESCWHVLVASRSQCLNMTTWDLFTPKHGDFGPFFFPKKSFGTFTGPPCFGCKVIKFFHKKKKEKRKKLIIIIEKPHKIEFNPLSFYFLSQRILIKLTTWPLQNNTFHNI